MDRIPKPGELYRHFTNKIYQIITIAVHAQTGERLIVYQEMFGKFDIYASSLEQFLEKTDLQKYPQAVQEHLFEKVDREELDADSQHKNKELQLGNAVWPTQKSTSDTVQITTRAGARSQAESFTELGTRSRIHSTVESEMRPQPHSTAESEMRPQPHSTAESEMRPQPYSTAESEMRPQPHSTAESEVWPRTHSPAESKRALRQDTLEESGEDSYYYKKRRRQLEEREQRRELFRKPKRHESATEELRANPCLLKFLDAETYEEKFQVLNEIQDDITDRLIDDIAVVLDVVIPEGPLNDRYHQLRNIILTRQKFETNRFR